MELSRCGKICITFNIFEVWTLVPYYTLQQHVTTSKTIFSFFFSLTSFWHICPFLFPPQRLAWQPVPLPVRGFWLLFSFKLPPRHIPTHNLHKCLNFACSSCQQHKTEINRLTEQIPNTRKADISVHVMGSFTCINGTRLVFCIFHWWFIWRPSFLPTDLLQV